MLTKSYVHGSNKSQLLGETLGSNFDAAAARWSDREALVVRHQNIRWTYKELQIRVHAFAAGLLGIGLEPGDRIGIWSQNNSEWVVTQYATAKAGLILVNINPAYRLSELEYAISKVGCKALILSESFKSSDYVAMVRELAPEVDKSSPGALDSMRLPTLRSVIQIGGKIASGFKKKKKIPQMAVPDSHDRIKELENSLQFDDPINIQFTSGTTGFPICSFRIKTTPKRMGPKTNDGSFNLRFT